MEHRTMKLCQRCGKDGVSWTADEVDLFGGVVANLCPACKTEWNSYLSDTGTWSDVVALTARENHYRSLALAQQPVGEGVWADHHALKHKLEREAHALGLEFIKPINAEARAVVASDEDD
jgi:hypothetical protein